MKTHAVTLACLLLAAACHATRVGPSEPVETRIQRLLRDTPLVDGHNDLVVHFHGCGEKCPRWLDAYPIEAGASGQTDIARWRRGLLGAQLHDNEQPTLEGTLRGLQFVQALVARHPGDLALAHGSEDIRKLNAEGRIAILPALEHPGRLGDHELQVRKLAAAGLRSNILAYDGPSTLADGHAGPRRHGGLSPLGERLVGWMQASGILVDLSHASPDTMRDTLAIARAPVVFSHSNAAALCDVARNVPDDVLRRLPSNGGIVMVAFVPYLASSAFAQWMARGDAHWEALLRAHAGNRDRASAAMAEWEREHPPPQVGVDDVVAHIEHIRDVAGIDHVGIGADFDGMAFRIRGLEDASAYPRLFQALARKGWSDTDLAKLAGGNFLRVLDAADAAAGNRLNRP